MIKLNSNEAINKILEMRLSLKSRLRTNCIYTSAQVKELIVSKNMTSFGFENSIFLIEEIENFFKLYFYISDENDLLNINKIKNFIESDFLISFVQKESKILDIYRIKLESLNFNQYKSYLRLYAIPKNINFIEGPIKNIEFAKKDDIYEIRELLDLELDIYTDKIATVEELKNLIQKKNVLCVKKYNEICGILIFEDTGKVSYLRCLCVSKKYRKQKIGLNLLSNYLYIHKESFLKFTLWVESKNTPAINLYKKINYISDNLYNFNFLYKFD